MGKKATATASLPELPHAAQVGDRVRLKEGRVLEYIDACTAAGWSFDATAIRTIMRQDHNCAGGGRRLFFDGPPFCFSERDVTLAWNTDDERRQELRRRGWKV